MKPAIKDVLPLVNAYFANPGNGVGGNLHIVLEDGNIANKDIEYCLECARRDNDLDGVALARLLLQMSRTQRKKIYMRHK